MIFGAGGAAVAMAAAANTKCADCITVPLWAGLLIVLGGLLVGVAICVVIHRWD